MSDHIKECWKTLRNHRIIGTVPNIQLKRFKESCQPIRGYYLNAYDVKKAKSDTTYCERLYPARIIAPSFNFWLTARIFPGRNPRNSLWMICVLLVLKPKNWKRIWKILFIRIRNINAGSESISNCLRLRIIINAGYNLFTPRLKPVTTVDSRKYSFRIRIYLYRVWNINAGSEILSQTMIPRILIRTRSF